MTAIEVNTTREKPASLSPLKIFLVKVAAITCAALLFFYFAFSLVTGFIEDKTDELAILKGGPAFWNGVETKLYKLASAPDMPPEKKEKIVSAVRTLSLRYRPFVDAIVGGEKVAPSGR